MIYCASFIAGLNFNLSRTFAANTDPQVFRTAIFKLAIQRSATQGFVSHAAGK
jgi:hypothetical protein